MLQIRRSEERGAASHGWLDSRHDQALKGGDGIKISAVRHITFDQAEQAEALLFDLPA